MFDITTLQGTALSAVTFGDTTFLIYQTSDGALHRIVEDASGNLTTEDFDFSPILGSPLASISWEHAGTNELRLYYLDYKYKIKEHCCTQEPGKDARWYNGALNTSDAGKSVTANPSAGLSAIVYLDANDASYLRVYYQDLITLKIMQLRIDNSTQWWLDDSLIVAAGGTGIAAVTYPTADGTQEIRYYYQDTEVKLKEQIFDGSSWSEGYFQPGQVTVRGPISADVQDKDIYVYWRKLNTDSVFGVTGIDPNVDDPATVEPIGDVPSVFQQAALVLNTQLRFYYQDKGGQLGYYYSNDNGDNWYPMGTN